MSKYLILGSSYFPIVRPNTLCLETIRQRLIAMGHQVDYLVLRHNANEHDRDIENGRVMYCESVMLNEYNAIADNGKDYSNISVFQKIWLRLSRSVRMKRYEFLSDRAYDSIIIDSALAKVIAENAKTPYDHMICVSHPFGLAKVAGAVKESIPNIIWTQYMLDPFVYDYAADIALIEQRKKLFIKYTNGVDKLILTRGIDEENKRQGYLHGLESRSTIVDLPNLMERKRLPSIINLPDKIECLFTGMFYDDIRNPEQMLHVMSKLKIDNLIISTMGGGCESVLAKYKGYFGDRLNIRGNIPFSECMQYVEGANILINLGNTIPNQIPSKVFEYIASGKPVINFYSNENDTSLYYFSKYPLAFNFNLTNYNDSDIISLNDFIINNADNRITFDQATINLQECLSANVVEKIIDFIHTK